MLDSHEFFTMFRLLVTLSFGLVVATTSVFSRDSLLVGQNVSSITSDRKIQVYFSPNGHCEQAIVEELNRAKKTVLVLAYSFTSAPIARALGEAKDRGVEIQVILDKSQKRARYSVINYLQSHEIPVFIDIPHAIAHNKVMIIDGQDVITGSYNFTSSAEKRNAENLVIIQNDPQIASVYTREWHHLNSQSALAAPNSNLYPR